MIEYTYKGFKISYKIVETEAEINSYRAEGTVSYLPSMPNSFKPQKFHTEYDTYAGTEHEIKKLLEHYIDFELKNFHDMKKENGERERIVRG